MDCRRLVTNQKECSFLTEISEAVESFIEDPDKFQMFIHIPVEELGVGTEEERKGRFTRLVATFTETVSQYYVCKFRKDNNERLFAPLRRFQQRPQADRSFAEDFNSIYPEECRKKPQLTNKFLIITHSSIPQICATMPERYDTPYIRANSRLSAHQAWDYDVVVVIGDRFYSDSWLSDWFQTAVNRGSNAKLIVVGTKRPALAEFANDDIYDVSPDRIETAYRFWFAHRSTHNLQWTELETFDEWLQGLQVGRSRLLLSPFVKDLTLVDKEEYRGFLEWAKENVEDLSEIDIDCIVEKCEGLNLFTASPKYSKYQELLRQTPKRDTLCVVNRRLPNGVDKDCFIKVASSSAYPSRSVKSKRGKRFYILNSPYENVLSLLELCCIRGEIHVLCYEKFESTESDTSVAPEVGLIEEIYWEDFETKSSRSNGRQKQFEVTLDDGNTRIISGNIIYNGRIVGAEDFYNDFDKSESCYITICNDDAELLTAYMKQCGFSLDAVVVNWKDVLRGMLDRGTDIDTLYKLCKEKGYTSSKNTFKNYFNPDAPEFPGSYKDFRAVLSILDVIDEQKNALMRTMRIYQNRPIQGRRMHWEVLNYKLTGQGRVVDSRFDALLEEIKVKSIKELKR